MISKKNTLNGNIVLFFNCECTGICGSPAGFWFSTTSPGGIPEEDTGLTVLSSLSRKKKHKKTHRHAHMHYTQKYE